MLTSWHPTLLRPTTSYAILWQETTGGLTKPKMVCTDNCINIKKRGDCVPIRNTRYLDR